MIPTHPIQPLVPDANDVIRFKANKIVTHLLKCCENRTHADMNSIAAGDFSKEDRIQFAQLIGYSWSGAGDLSYMPADVIDAAWKSHETGVTAEVARLEIVEARLESLRELFREPVAELFGIHPEDLAPEED